MTEHDLKLLAALYIKWVPRMKMHHCFNCGELLGVYPNYADYDYDTCGKLECERAARDAMAQERPRSMKLDRDRGWD